MSIGKSNKYIANLIGTRLWKNYSDQGGIMQHIRGSSTCLETQVGFCCLRKKKSVITSHNSHISLGTLRQTYQTHSKDQNQAFARTQHLSNTPLAIITLKLQKQGKACSLSAIFHFSQTFLPKPVHIPSLPSMQAIQKLKHDL